MDENDSFVRWKTFFVDLFILGTGGIILLVISLAVTPTRRGFYCEDDSIRYKFTASTIPTWALYIYCLAIPILLIIVTEILMHRETEEMKRSTFLSFTVPNWFNVMYRSVVDFLFGCIASQLATDIGKYSIGRLRPNFLDVCHPNVTLDSCNGVGQEEHKYILNYICTTSDDDARGSRVSFPSGHASFSTYTMLYIAIYIHIKWPVDDTNKNTHWRLFRSGIQLFVLLVAYFTALSRVMDNQHHWSDILGGAVLGVLVAFLTSRHVSTLMTNESYFTPIKRPSKTLSSQFHGRRTKSINNAETDLDSNDQPVNTSVNIAEG